MTSIGLNISGGEWGGTGGTHNVQYHYPTLAELKYYADKGVDLIRLPIRWERVQDTLGGELDLAGDIALLKQVLADAASLGMDVVIDVHNYGRYNDVAIGAVGGPTIAQFADFWQKMAVQFKDFSSLVGYDLMNEPHDMPAPGVWKAAAQAATDAIRTVDMNNIIYVEGDGWSSAHTWLNNNKDLIINDPANRIIYQAHGYYDHYNEGMYRYSYEGEGAYPMIGVDRLKPFVEWLQANNLQGMIGEFGIPSNDPRWLEVQKNALDYMIANGLEATAWAGGAWFDPSYVVYTARPGSPDSAYMDLLEGYFNDYKDPFGATAPTPPVTAAPSVAVSDVTTNETDNVMVFTLTRSGDLTKTSSVNYSTANGTASAGSDYSAASGTANFAAGQSSAKVSVQITNDTLVEGQETVLLNLSGGTNITIADAQAIGTIVSDDSSTSPTPPTGFPSSPTVVGTESNDDLNADWSREDYVDAKGGDDNITAVWSKDYIDGGAGNDTISYRWSGWVVDIDLLRSSQLSGDAEGDVLVNIENITGGNHNDILRGDDRANILNGLGGQDILTGRGGSDRFVFTSGAEANNDVITDYSSADTLDFTAFNPKFLSITNDGVNTRIVGDSNADGAGDFTVILNGVHTSVNGVTAGSAPPPPPPPPPTVAINDVTVDERAGTINFTVTRSGTLTSSSSVNFATANGSALAGSDYTALTGTVTFAAGETTKTISVAIANDTLVENAETLTVNLSGGTNVTISDAQGVGTINSDDVASPSPTPVAPSVSVGDATASEGGGALVFTLTRSGDLSLASSVSFATANGSAAAGSDYNAVSGSVSFGAGQATATVSVSIIDDTLVEISETVLLNLTGGTNATISDAQGVGTINSNDVESPQSGTIMGTDGSEIVNGTSGADIINAMGGSDLINGGGGADRLTGGGGPDRFVFDSAANADGDVITDFTIYSDRLDLRGIDADTGRNGSQKFTWIDTAEFTGQAGQLREYSQDGRHYIAGDTNGDRIADFRIELMNVTNLTPTDFLF